MLALRIASATVAALATSALLIGQVKTNVPEPVSGARPVTVERITVHGAALEGNLEGNAVDRDVIVFLPPSYSRERTRRCPVIYALHGYSIGAAQWSEEIHAPQTIEGAFAKGATETLSSCLTRRPCTTVRCTRARSQPATSRRQQGSRR
jgi:hypothetical protein